jgi:hypothetical protein
MPGKAIEIIYSANTFRKEENSGVRSTCSHLRKNAERRGKSLYIDNISKPG